MVDVVNVILGLGFLAFLVIFGASFFGWAVLPTYDFDTREFTYKTFAGLTEDDRFDFKGTEPLACIEIFQPVCGVDGNTYSNSCFAGDVDILHEGQC